MTEPTAPMSPPPAPPGAWQAPVEELGPAPGIEFAGHGARLLSYLLDTFIVGVASVIFAIVVVTIVAAAGSPAGGIALVSILIIGLIVLWLGYWPWFWMRGGQTPGMRPFGLYVVDDRTGGSITGGAAVLRYIGYIVNGVAFYIGFAWILIDKRRRGWHDLIAGTVVIKR